MHFQIPLILAIAATALAFPTTNQTTSTLSKRDRHSWIGSYNDEQCTGPQIGPRPELHHHRCTHFTPANAFDLDNASEYFGVYFGSGVYDYGNLGIFSDKDCKNSVAGLGFDKLTNAINGFACSSVSDLVQFPGQIGSVMADWDPN